MNYLPVWLLIPFAFLSFQSFAEIVGQRHYQQGQREDYYRAPQVKTTQGHRGVSESQIYRDNYGRYVTTHSYQTGAGYSASTPQGVLGSGNYGSTLQKTQTYSDLDTAQYLSNANAETAKRLTSLEKSMARLDNASLVIAEEVKKFSLSKDISNTAQTAVTQMKAALKDFHDFKRERSNAVNFGSRFDEALTTRNALKQKVESMAGTAEEREAAQRVYTHVKESLHYATFTGIFWNEWGQ